MAKRNKQEKAEDKRQYRKKLIKKGWLVINTRTGRHTHVKSEYGAGCLLLFLREGVVPENAYLKESMRRLEDNADRKQNYYNQR